MTAVELQTYLANTAHQREVADLQAAGLNPVLSAGGSGAAVPNVMSGSSDGSANSAKAVASAAKYNPINKALDVAQDAVESVSSAWKVMNHARETNAVPGSVSVTAHPQQHEFNDTVFDNPSPVSAKDLRGLPVVGRYVGSAEAIAKLLAKPLDNYVNSARTNFYRENYLDRAYARMLLGK